MRHVSEPKRTIWCLRFCFRDAELVIPEVAQVQANQYAGQVNWNLVKAP
ncbi:hypothetical protein ACH0DO_002124 [Enterococcus hirae]|nr:hypothetical protein [Enterococcus hirae]